jgi:SAM-dependent methyltransferase
LYSKLLGQNRDVPIRADFVVLDVGCGEGRYLLEKRQAGCRCYGVDISAAALLRLQQVDPAIKTHCGNLWDANFPDSFFDVINLSHVLEHVTEFSRLLSETRRILKPGGSLRVQVPNAASLSFWIFGKCWMPLDVPRHVYVFSIKNLKRLFEGAGFEIVNSRTLENSFSVIGSLFYTFNEWFGKKIELMRHERIWNNELVKLLFFPYSLFVNLFRIGDSVEFILKKR